jgi:LPPG:FO 2-phospho-L-lactate transferase
LYVSPDLDSITYALAGLLSTDRGWGVEGDTFECLGTMRRMGNAAWFSVGDRDLATHLSRTELLKAGKSLSQATEEISQRLGVTARIIPMTNERIETRIQTSDGDLSFQEYFVRERWQPQVRGVRFVGAEQATPAPGVLEAIRTAEAIVIAPSNPVTSIGPILAVPRIREALRNSEAPVAAISPIVGGAAVSGPTGVLMSVQGLLVSVAGIAQAYGDFLNALIVDESDAEAAAKLRSSGIEVHCTNTIMKSPADKIELARDTLQLVSGTHAKSA